MSRKLTVLSGMCSLQCHLCLASLAAPPPSVGGGAGAPDQCLPWFASYVVHNATDLYHLFHLSDSGSLLCEVQWVNVPPPLSPCCTGTPCHPPRWPV